MTPSPPPSRSSRSPLPDGLPIPSEDDFTSRLRSPAVAARVGLWLGISFGVCFLTGLISHYAQNGNQPIPFPASPFWGYRVTQGLHVISGTAAIPLLLVKLWAVYPRLFQSMPCSCSLRSSGAMPVSSCCASKVKTSLRPPSTSASG